MTTRLPWYRLAGLTLFALAFGIGANSLEPAVLGQRFLELAPERKNTALGLTTAAGLLVATLVQPVVGGFSDRTAGRLGRRIPYFIVGAVLASAAPLGGALSGYLVAEGRALAAVASAAAALFVALLLTGLAARRDIAPAGGRPAPPSTPLPRAGQAPGLRAALTSHPSLPPWVVPRGVFL